jgi:dTDP-L-rhamnose 4-epimerase
MSQRVLITGGAGFVGSHLADDLLGRGYTVRALDNLTPQVHGISASRPAYLHPDVELVVGDVRDPQALEPALDGVDTVFHLAALVGVGQSMYQMHDYVSVNNGGTAVLLELLAKRKVRKLVVASSMSLYGEGLYRASDGTLRTDAGRSLEQLRRRDWEPRDTSGKALQPLPTPETKTPALASIYALTKYDQEQMCLIAGKAYGYPVVALRFFNIYGTRQALSNPYTGVLAIFASRLLNDRPPIIYEDGGQSRDFVSVRDIAAACRLAMESDRADGEILNVGSGRPTTVREVYDRLAMLLGREIAPEIASQYRMGDIRHCFADIWRIRALLGYEPSVSLEAGLAELAAWLKDQPAEDRVEHAAAELGRRGLTV